MSGQRKDPAPRNQPKRVINSRSEKMLASLEVIQPSMESKHSNILPKEISISIMSNYSFTIYHSHPTRRPIGVGVNSCELRQGFDFHQKFHSIDSHHNRKSINPILPKLPTLSSITFRLGKYRFSAFRRCELRSQNWNNLACITSRKLHFIPRTPRQKTEGNSRTANAVKPCRKQMTLYGMLKIMKASSPRINSSTLHHYYDCHSEALPFRSRKRGLPPQGGFVCITVGRQICFCFHF